MIGTNKFDHSVIGSHLDEVEDSIVDNTAATARLTAAALHLMSAYAQCACPRLAVVVEAHIAELARVTPDVCIRTVCEALQKNWPQKIAPCATKICLAENVSETTPAHPGLLQKIRQIKFH